MNPTANAAPATSWVDLLEAAGLIFDRYSFFFFPRPEDRDVAILSLMDLIAGIREYAIVSRDDLSDFWEELRKNQLVVDMIVAITGDIYLETTWEAGSVADKLASSILLCGNASEHNATDQAFLESLGETKQLKALLLSNLWFVTLCLLRRSGRCNLVRPILLTHEGKEAS